MVLSAMISFVNFKSDIRYIFLTCIFVFWHFGNVCIYVLMIQKLNYAMTDSMLSFNKTTKIILYILISLYFCATLVLIPYFTGNISSIDTVSDDLSQLLVLIYVNAYMSLDFIMSSILLCHFIRKLKIGYEKIHFSDINNNTNNNDTNNIDDSNNIDNNNNNDLMSPDDSVQYINSDSRSVTLLSINSSMKNHTKYVFETILFSKLSVLYIIIAISTQINVITFIVYAIVSYSGHSDGIGNVFRLIWVYYTLIDNVIKPFCVSLCFIFGNKCFGTTFGCLERIIRKKVKRKHTQRQSS